MNVREYARIATRILNLIFWMIIGYLAGDLGFGFYFISFMVFYLAASLLTGGIKIAVAKMVEVRRQKGLYHNCKLVFRYGLLYCLVSGLLVCTGLWLFSGTILNILIGYRLPESVLSIFGIYFFVNSIKSCIMGYFQGKGDVYVCIVGEIIGCIVMVALAPVFITRMYLYGMKVATLLKQPMYANINGVIGAILAQCIAGTVCILAVLIGDRIAGTVGRNMYDSVKGLDNIRSIYLNFFKINGMYIIDKIFPLLSIAGVTFIYIRNAYSMSFEEREVFIRLGVWGGKYLIVMAFLMIFFIEYVDRECKSIRIDISRDELKNVYTRTVYLIKNSFFILVPVALFVIIMAKPIVTIFFDGRMSLGITLLRAGGIIFLFFGLTHMCKGILNAHKMTLYSVAGSVLGLAVTIAFAFATKGTEADPLSLIYALLAGYLVQAVAMLAVVYLHSKPDIIDIGYKLAKIFIGSALFSGVLAVMDNFLIMNPIFLIITIAVSYGVYYVTIAVLKGLTKRDINSLKGTIAYYPAYFIGSFFV